MNSQFSLELEKKFEGGFKPSLFQTLNLCYQPYRSELVIILFLGLMGRTLALSNTNLVGVWVDTTVRNHVPFEFFQSWKNDDFLVLLLVITFIGFCFTAIFRIRFSRLSARAVSTLYDETTFRISRAPMSFFDSNPLGRIMTRFSSDYGNVFRLFGGPLAEFFSIVFDLLAFVILMTLVHPSFLILTLLYIASTWLVYFFNRDRLRLARRELSRQRGPSIAHFAETVQGAVNIRLFEKESLFRQRFTTLDSYYLESKKSTFLRVVTFILEMSATSTLWFLIVGLFSVWGLNQGFLSLGDVGTALGLIMISFSSIQMFFEWLSQLEEGFVGVERLDDYLRRPIEKYAKLPHKARYKTEHEFEKPLPTPFHGLIENFDIRFNNVHFRYLENQAPILSNLNLIIPERQRLGIIGRTGSGKSSLLQVLTYLYPFDGDVSIGHLNPKAGSDLNLYRSMISYLPQEPALLRNTLRANLDLEKKRSDAEIIRTLEQVGMGPWFRSVGQNLDFELQEKGKNLSIGERQLLGLARCLLQNAPILILDEATSALDPATEKIVLNVLENEAKNKTLIFIAHRLQTLKFCDQILWIEKGKIKAYGKPQDLLSQFEIPQLGE
jgi:ABC-type multidrug transport system fused ATPase/permease subunit